MDYHLTSSAITAKKKTTLSRTVRNLKRRTRRMPKKANRLGRMFNLSVELVTRKITLKNDVDKAQVRISSLNVIGLKTHRTTVRTTKHKTTTQHHTTILYQSDNMSDLILQPKFSNNISNN